METTMRKKRIKYVNRVATRNKSGLGTITETTHKRYRNKVTDKISDDIGIMSESKVVKNRQPSERERNKWKKEEQLKGAGKNKSKVKFFLENKNRMGNEKKS